MNCVKVELILLSRHVQISLVILNQYFYHVTVYTVVIVFGTNVCTTLQARNRFPFIGFTPNELKKKNTLKTIVSFPLSTIHVYKLSRSKYFIIKEFSNICNLCCPSEEYEVAFHTHAEELTHSLNFMFYFSAYWKVD